MTRQWKKEAPVGWQTMSGPWTPAGITAEDLAARSEKCFVWVPGLNRWCLVGFIIDASPDNSLACVVGKHATDRNTSVFLEAYLTVPSNSNYARTLCPLVVPDGNWYRLVLGVGRTSASTGHVLTCTDFGGTSTWITRTGPFGSVTHSITSMVWTGSAIVGGSTSDTQVARSTTLGNSWTTPYNWTSTITKVVTNGQGIVLAFSTAANYIRSTDHGATWTTETLPDWTPLTSLFDVVWGIGNFVVMNTEGDTWMSKTGADGTWNKRTRVMRDPSLAIGAPQGRAYRSLVACGQMIVCPWGVDGGSGSFTHFGLMFSLDGYTFHQSAVFGRDWAPPTNFSREVHLASSTPPHAAAPYSPFHQLVWYPGDLNDARGLFSPVDFRGIPGWGENERLSIDYNGEG